VSWLRSRLLPLLTVACLAGYVHAYTGGIAGTPIRSDAFSYFVYLPSWLIFHDPSLQAVADDCCGGEFPEFTAMTRWPWTRRWVNPHPIGEAVMIAPFFAAAHALTRWSNLSPNGFTLYYQHAAGLAGLAYAVAGLWFVRRLLRRHFSAGVTDATIVALLFGTSLFHYATFDSTWSHAFSFALCAALFERCDRWREGNGTGAALVIGALSGLIVLVRHTNALIPALLVGTLLVCEPSFRRHAATAIVAGAAVVFPQLWIYHAATRHWIVGAYAGTPGFSWTQPHVFEVLFGTAKGLFFWAPLLLAAVGGLLALPPPLARYRAAIAAALLLDTYLIASWFDWQLGASYGHRGFVDLYPLLAPGLAVSFAWFARGPARRRAAATVVVLLCALSMFQMLQYWHGLLPMSDITWAQYRSLFLKPW
jgi:hypothetical protein